MTSLSERIDIDKIRALLKGRIRLLFTLLQSAIGSQYGAVRDYLIAFIEEATEEEIDEVLTHLDEAGHHLVHAWRHAVKVIVTGADVAERASEDETFQSKLSQYESDIEDLAEFMEGTLEMTADADIRSDYFSKTMNALRDNAPAGDGEAGVPEEDVGLEDAEFEDGPLA